jgi:hypothetical protein
MGSLNVIGNNSGSGIGSGCGDTCNVVRFENGTYLISSGGRGGVGIGFAYITSGSSIVRGIVFNNGSYNASGPDGPRIDLVPVIPDAARPLTKLCSMVDFAMRVAAPTGRNWLWFRLFRRHSSVNEIVLNNGFWNALAATLVHELALGKVITRQVDR